MADANFVTYETVDDGQIARIMLNRPEARNAQNRGLLVELNDAFLRAEADDTVRVVILGGVGPMFSSGHDMGSEALGATALHSPYSAAKAGVVGLTRSLAVELGRDGITVNCICPGPINTRHAASTAARATQRKR